MRTSSVRMGITLAFSCAAALGIRAQEPEGGGAWFGVTRPPTLAPHSLEVLSGRPTVPPLVSAGEDDIPI
jgi:hypothetical protein